MQQWKRQRRWVERLAGKVKQHRAVLADRVQQYRALALRDRLAQDVDALGLEPVEMRQHATTVAANWTTFNTL
jgi:hypothetical protein